MQWITFHVVVHLPSSNLPNTSPDTDSWQSNGSSRLIFVQNWKLIRTAEWKINFSCQLSHKNHSSVATQEWLVPKLELTIESRYLFKENWIFRNCILLCRLGVLLPRFLPIQSSSLEIHFLKLFLLRLGLSGERQIVRCCGGASKGDSGVAWTMHSLAISGVCSSWNALSKRCFCQHWRKHDNWSNQKWDWLLQIDQPHCLTIFLKPLVHWFWTMYNWFQFLANLNSSL